MNKYQTIPNKNPQDPYETQPLSTTKHYRAKNPQTNYVTDIETSTHFTTVLIAKTLLYEPAYAKRTLDTPRKFIYTFA